MSHRLRNTGLISSRIGLTSCGEGPSLALADYPFSNGATIIILYGGDVLLHQPACTPSFSVGLLKTESESLDQLRLA